MGLRSRLVAACITLITVFCPAASAQRANKIEMVLQTGHQHELSGSASVFSPDGRMLATNGGIDKSVLVWQVSTMYQLRAFNDTHEIQEIAFTDDSTSILTRTFSSIKQWDIRSGRLVKQIDHSSSYRGTHMAVGSADNKVFVADGSDQSSRLIAYDLITGNKVLDVPGPNTLPGAMSVNTLNDQIICAYKDRSIRFFNARTGSAFKTLTVPAGDVNALTISPDGKILAAAISIGVTVSDSAKAPPPAAVSPQSKAMVQTWDVASGRPIRSFNVTDANSFIDTSISISSDGKTLAACNVVCDFWKTTTGSAIEPPENDQLKYELKNCVFSSRQAIMACRDFLAIAIRDASTMKLLRKTTELHAPDLNKISISPDGRNLMASYFPNALLWDLSSGGGVRKIIKVSGGETGSREPMSAINFHFSPDGQHVAAAVYDVEKKAASIELVEINSGTTVRTFEGIMGTESSDLFGSDGMVFSPNGTLLAVVDLPGDPFAGLPTEAQQSQAKLKLWNVADGRELRSINIGKYKNHLTISPDGRTVMASRGGDEFAIEPRMKLWDIARGNELPAPAVDGFDCAFHPQGKIVACREGLGRLAFWDLESLEKLSPVEPFKSNLPLFKEDSIKDFAFIGDGSDVMTLSFSGSVRIWDAFTGQLKRELKSERPAVGAAAGRDGKLIAIRDIDHKIILWDGHSGKELASLITLDGPSTEGASKAVPNRFEWLVTTPDGFFDGTAAGWKMLGWRFNNDAFDFTPVEGFFSDFYYPGLLKDVLSAKGPSARRNISTLDRRPPSVSLEVSDKPPSTGEDDASNERKLLRVVVTETPAEPSKGLPNGEVRDVRLFRNGLLVKIWHGQNIEELVRAGCKAPLTAAGQARTIICESEVVLDADENRFEAYAFNRDNVKSNDAAASVNNENSPLERTLYVLVVGIDEYADRSKDLKFAVADVSDVADAIEAGQEKLLNFTETKTIKLTDRSATKENVLMAMKLFAGHLKDEEGDVPFDIPLPLLNI